MRGRNEGRRREKQREREIASGGRQRERERERERCIFQSFDEIHPPMEHTLTHQSFYVYVWRHIHGYI